jgi:hypothetical protein
VFLVCIQIRPSGCAHWIAVDTAILRVSDSMSDQTEALETGYWRQNHIVAVLQVLQVMVKDT